MNLDSSPYWGGGGKSAYDIWIEQGNTGSEQDFLKSLTGPKGEKGEQGIQGIPGPNKIANNLTTTDVSYALSANQGKVLNDRINKMLSDNDTNKAYYNNVYRFHPPAPQLPSPLVHDILWPLTLCYIKINNVYIVNINLNVQRNSCFNIESCKKYFTFGISATALKNMLKLNDYPKTIKGTGFWFYKDGTKRAFYKREDTNDFIGSNTFNGFGLDFEYNKSNEYVTIGRTYNTEGAIGKLPISEFEVGTVINGTLFIIP